jgi:hypothetical protein
MCVSISSYAAATRVSIPFFYEDYRHPPSVAALHAAFEGAQLVIHILRSAPPRPEHSDLVVAQYSVKTMRNSNHSD